MSHAIDLFSSLMNKNSSQLPIDIASLLKEGESSLLEIFHYDKLITSIRRYDRALLDYFADPAVLDGVLSILFKYNDLVAEDEKEQLSLQAFNILSVNEDGIRNSILDSRGLLESLFMPLPYPPSPECDDEVSEESSQIEEEFTEPNLKIDIIIITSLLSKFFMKDPEGSLKVFSCGDNLLKTVSQIDSQNVLGLFLELIVTSPSTLIELCRDYSLIDYLINIIYNGNPQIPAGSVINTKPGLESLSQRCRSQALILLSAMLNNYNSDLARFIFSNHMNKLSSLINSMSTLLTFDKAVSLDAPLSQISDAVYFVDLSAMIINFSLIYYSNLCFSYYNSSEFQRNALIQALNEFAHKVGNAFDLIFSYEANPTVVVAMARLIDSMSSRDIATEVNEESCDSKTTATINLKECLIKFNVHYRMVKYALDHPNFTTFANILASVWGRVLDNHYNNEVISFILQKSEIMPALHKCLLEDPKCDFLNIFTVLIGSIDQFVPNDEVFEALEDHYNTVFSRPLTYSDPRLGACAIPHVDMDESSEEAFEKDMFSNFNNPTIKVDDWAKFTSANLK